MRRSIDLAVSCPVFAVLLAVLARGGPPANLEPGGGFQTVRRFHASEAVQGVAVGPKAFYAIANTAIGMYDNQSGKRLKRWQATAELPLVHLNAGIVRAGRLYCAHSNFPNYPESSSIEVWDAATLEHIETHSLGIYEGSLTWIDWHEGAWWAAFAHYTERVNDNPWAKDTCWTSLVKFDADWRRTAGWVFPPEVVERMQPHSSSGGGWGPGGRLFVSGHDRGELYELELPRAGSTLHHVRTLPAPITGQSIAWDRRTGAAAAFLYGIDRPRREVIVMTLAR